MKLIDANELLKALGRWDISRLYLVDSFKELIKEQPVVETVKKGGVSNETD